MTNRRLFEREIAPSIYAYATPQGQFFLYSIRPNGAEQHVELSPAMMQALETYLGSVKAKLTKQ